MVAPIGLRIVGQGGLELFNDCLSDEHKRINKEVLIEREWWAEKVIRDEALSLESGELIVVPDEGMNFRLISKLRSQSQPKTLRPLAYMLLLTIEAKWKLRTDQLPTQTGVFLSVSSLYRTFDLQKQLQENTNLASDGASAHCAGAAIDWDPQGYYWGNERKSVTALSSEFNPMYTLNLKEVLDQLVLEAHCHLIVEKGYRIVGNEVREHDACYHVCVSPHFFIRHEI